MNTTLETLTRGFWAHLREHPALPQPCLVSLYPHTPEVAVQVGTAEPVTHLGHLLLWAYTLTGVTARWWHTQDDYLHITLSGRAGHTRFRVFGGVRFTDCAGLIHLDMDAEENVSVDELYTLRELLRDHNTVTAGVIA